MQLIEGGAEKIKTITFPKTIRFVQNGAFSGRPLRSAILNEGLQKLGETINDWGDQRSGCFSGSQIEKITLPSTLSILG